jgi:hypothetical protein
MSARSIEPGGARAEITESRDPREPRVDGGRLGVYAALGATAGTIPLPWVPAALVRRVRGALVHDVAVRHGLSLSPEARDLLADPAGPEEPHGVVTRAARYVGVRIALRALTRIGPLRAIWPLGHALRMYVLGYLFDRYLSARPGGDPSPGARIDVGEARRVRQAIDAALVRATASTPATVDEPAVVDDSRDATTAFVDGLIGAAAGVPSHLQRRLDTAFDALMSEGHG